MRNAYRILKGNILGKQSLRKFRRRWEDKMKIASSKTGCEDGK
jgi:hypothetical protein